MDPNKALAAWAVWVEFRHESGWPAVSPTWAALHKVSFERQPQRHKVLWWGNDKLGPLVNRLLVDLDGENRVHADLLRLEGLVPKATAGQRAKTMKLSVSTYYRHRREAMKRLREMLDMAL